MVNQVTMNPNALIPSMFHRRLVLLTAMVVIVILVLFIQLYRLTVTQGEENRRNAEMVLVDRELIPTYRGKILDRNGQVLAEDRGCYEVLVDYRLISGAWVEMRAFQEARDRYKDVWDELSRQERESKAELYRGIYERELIEFWKKLAELSEISREEMETRRSNIEQRVERMARHVWEQWRKQRQAEWETTLTIEDVKDDIREQRIAHVILVETQPDKEAAYRRFADYEAPRISKSIPGVSIQPAGIRDYPRMSADITLDRKTLPGPLRSDDSIVIHVDKIAESLVGSMRDEVYPQDLEARPLYKNNRVADYGGYKVGDQVGSSGLERTYENQLRGMRGEIEEHLDTGMVIRQEPQPGEDVVLTIDINLQARIKAILAPEFGLTRMHLWQGQDSQMPAGMPLDAAAVVVDISTNEILAVVSSNNQLGQEFVNVEDDEVLYNSLNPSWVNLALNKIIAPGSIVKPLMLCAVISEGLWSYDQTVVCNGHYFASDPEHYRCWIYRAHYGYAVHGELGPIEAIARSCNIYFYTIGNTLGPQLQYDWYQHWGLGREFNLGIPTRPGIIGDPIRANAGEVLRRGIGQGVIAWSPLHAANAYAALARGGYYQDPILVKSPVANSEAEGYLKKDLQLDDQAVYMAMRGLDEVVNNKSYGGARQIDVDPDPEVRVYEPIFNAENVKVWGKTGTAQQNWPVRIVKYDAEGKPVFGVGKDRDKPEVIEREPGIGAHSWFVGLAGSTKNIKPGDSPRPAYAIAVFWEWGGSGSRGAGPIANQIIQALIAEGYL